MGSFFRACLKTIAICVASATDFGQGIKAGQSPKRAWPAEDNAAQNLVPPQPKGTEQLAAAGVCHGIGDKTALGIVPNPVPALPGKCFPSHVTIVFKQALRSDEYFNTQNFS